MLAAFDWAPSELSGRIGLLMTIRSPRSMPALTDLLPFDLLEAFLKFTAGILVPATNKAIIESKKTPGGAGFFLSFEECRGILTDR